jgi:hypothetical protein
MRKSVLASICTSLLWIGSLQAQDAPASLAAATFAEMEVSAARIPKVYLVLDPERRVLEVKARGAVLDHINILGIEILSQQSLVRTSLPMAPSLPAKWVVKLGPGDTDREVIAPKELHAAPKDDEEERPSKDAAKPTPAGPTPTPTPFPEAPASYRVQLGNGWDIWVTTTLPAQGRFQLIMAALRDGWHRLRGSDADVAPAISLLVSPDDSRRIHHLFRTGTEILVGPGV